MKKLKKELAKENIIIRGLDENQLLFGKQEIQYKAPNEEKLVNLFGNYKEKLQNFLNGSIYFDAKATEKYLQFNKEGYEEILNQRAINLLKWCEESSKIIQKYPELQKNIK
jgi:hypothetical protein